MLQRFHIYYRGPTRWPSQYESSFSNVFQGQEMIGCMYSANAKPHSVTRDEERNANALTERRKTDDPRFFSLLG